MTNITQKLSVHAASLLLGGVLLAPIVAAAQDPVPPIASPTISTTTLQVPKADTKLQPTKEKAYKEIDRRIQALSELTVRIAAMQRVTANFKQTLATNVQNQVAGLTQLKTKIEGDTDLATLKEDIKTITASYRVFALVMPQARIAVAADREVTLIAMLNQLGTKLQARISAAQSAGADVTALLAVLTNMSTKLGEANAKAQAAVSVSAALVPDEGDKTKMAQNTSALKAARADIQAAHKAIVEARKDADTINKGLKSALPPAAASSTTPR